MPILVLLFIAVPIIELFVIVQAAQVIGTPQTLLLLVVMSIVGAWLVKVEGLGVWRRFTATVSQGKVPHHELIDGVLILMAGALMLTPGFVTDAVGLLLLAPPTRALARKLLLARVTGSVFVAVPRTVWEASGRESGPDEPTEPPPGLDR